MSSPLEDAAARDRRFSCPTCRDQGEVACILSLESDQTALVTLNGEPHEVALDLLDGVQPGDFVLVHLDTAIAKLNRTDVITEGRAA